MGVVVEDKSADFLKRLNVAIDGPGGGLARATYIAAGKAKESMPGAGASVVKGTGGNTGVRSRFIASRSGNPPGVRTGLLRNSLTNARVGKMRWAFGTNVKYARIMEKGGTINHPGGTAYVTFGGRAHFVKNANAKWWMRRTAPHPIKIPARPYLRPVIRKHRKLLQKEFNQRVRQRMGVTA